MGIERSSSFARVAVSAARPESLNSRDSDVTNIKHQKCGICGEAARLIVERQPACQAPATFDVYDCPSCDTRFAWPMKADGQIYEVLYRNTDAIPGYDRYKRYAKALLTHPKPLDYLAGEEDVYWSIKTSLSDIAGKLGRPLRILEIGSGLGYLTYALRKSGHDCIGIDISQSAIERAKAAFGNHYQAVNLADFTDTAGSGFDVVVATELLEHIADPARLLKDAARHVRPGGAILITTPNKDLYSSQLAWHTDLAPVHFWWFSKTSLRRMAWGAELDVRFLDFSEFYGATPGVIRGGSKPQVFDERGNVVFRDSALNTIARRLLAMDLGLFRTLGRVFIRRTMQQKFKDALYTDSLSLCAILRRRA
jgi:2-polyprenyl-3-methyl-5-hydroxy-6-metoxy-1,4-benzoquinol methylase